MRKNGKEAADYMKGLAANNAAGVKGYCLRTCRLAWGLAPDQPSAILEWESIPSKYKNKNPLTAPVGAPHFWRGGKYGHVAIQAEHEGYVWSTDAPTRDRVGLVDLEWFKKKWRSYTYLGWSSQLQNKVLPLGQEAPKKPVRAGSAKPAQIK